MALPQNINAILVQSLHDMMPLQFAKDHPFLDRMSKKTAGGSGYRIPVATGGGGGSGSDFILSLTNANVGGLTAQAFVPVPTQAFGHEIIDWTARAFTMDTPAHSEVDVAVLALKTAFEITNDNLATSILAAAPGVMATISSSTNPTGNQFILTMTVPTDVIKFSIEDVVTSAATSASSLDAGTAKVIGVNPIAGTVYVDALATGWTPTNGHVVGRQGSLGNSGVPGTVFAWNPPSSARTNGVVGDTFLGVPRTQDSQVIFTSGWAFSALGQPINVVVQNAAGYMANYNKNAKPDTLFCNPTVLAQLAVQFGQQVRYDMKSTGGLTSGFAGFDIVTAAGKVEVLAEPAMPSNQILLTKASSWVYATPQGKLIVPATNGKVWVDAFGKTEGNVSRTSLMSTGFFGCDNLAASCNITIDGIVGLSS